MYQWLVFTHVLGVFGFLLAHGTAAAVAFKLRGEREIERVRVLLDLSRGSSAVGNASLLVLLAAGIAAGFMGNWWGQYWIWAALGVLVLISVAMLIVGSGPLIRIRQVVQPELVRSKRTSQPIPEAVTEQQLGVMLAAVHPALLTAIGGGGLAVILWLMLFKPF
ncbi:MAG TPA: hypothetical protein VKT52_00760 [Ktedonobacterales bacterium]|nr:hypothetical protein [Ktedonobacterales bacterium]